MPNMFGVSQVSCRDMGAQTGAVMAQDENYGEEQFCPTQWGGIISELVRRRGGCMQSRELNMSEKAWQCKKN